MGSSISMTGGLLMRAGRSSLLAVLLAVCLNGATVVNDKAAGALLLGTHPLSLQWVTFDKTKGSVTVTDSGGVYRVKGEQKGKGTDSLLIEGEVVSVNAKDFTFKGRIVTRVSYIAGGKACVREGTFLFRISGARQFWRMREQANPCEEVADYVDIFFVKTK
jgi:hypothetical protein